MQKFDKSKSDIITKEGRSNMKLISEIIENGGKLKFLPITKDENKRTYRYVSTEIESDDTINNIFNNLPTIKYKLYNLHPKEIKTFLKNVFEMKDCEDKSFLKSYFQQIHGIHIDIYFGKVKVNKRYSFTIDTAFSSTCENIKILESMKVPMIINVPRTNKL